MAAKKGNVVETIDPYLLVSLVQGQIGLPESLPRASEAISIPCQNDWIDTDECREFVGRTLRKSTTAGYTAVTTLAAALTKDIDCESIKEVKLSDEEEEMLTEAFPFAQSRLGWKSFLAAYDKVRRIIYLGSEPHPLSLYASNILPNLDLNDLKAVYSALQTILKLPSKIDEENLFLCIVQAIEDQCQPLAVGVLPRDLGIDEVKHSCLPNTAYNWHGENQKFQILALYDLEEHEEHLISVGIEGCTTLKERQALHEERFGSRCDCVRCYWEESDDLPNNVRDAIRMGHLAFQQQRFVDAVRCYKHVVQQDATQSDVWHAIGAVHLTQNKFRQAQQHWKQAAEKHSLLRKHKGIALQLTKQNAYAYFRETQVATPTQSPKYTSWFDGLCFVTDEPVLPLDACEQVIKWANTASSWTTSRHYAVPTNDVPVHTVPELLKWFNDWMNSIICPLLGKQFGVAPQHFFTHDAFVVRYEAGKNSNFLPIHVDESTHSFVLALNGSFEGGGTYFSDYQKTLAPKQPGTLVSFQGDALRHGGNIVTTGTRYILAVFLYHDPSVAENGASKSRKRALSSSCNNESFTFGFQV